MGRPEHPTSPAFVGRALLVVGVVFLPLGIQRQVVGDVADVPFPTAAYLFPFDVAFAVCAALAVPHGTRWVRSHSVPPWMIAFSGLVAMSIVAAVVTPDARGGVHVARVVVALLLAVFVATTPLRSGAALVLLVTAGVQTALSIAQVVHGAPLGLDAIGEYDLPLDDLVGTTTARGTWFHAYALAAFALLYAGSAAALVSGMASSVRRRLLPFVAIAAGALGVTHSRTAVVGVLLVAAALVIGRRATRATQLAALMLVLGLLVPATIWRDGWAGRARATTAAVREGEGANAVSNNRVHRIRLALDLTSRHPITGVGPGRYVVALTRELDLPPDEDIGPVHSFPFLALAETGALGGAAAAAFLLLLGARAVQGGPRSLAVYATYLPFVLLDHVPYTTGQGLAMVGLWAGAVEALSRPRAAPASDP